MINPEQAAALARPLQFLSATFMGIVFWEYVVWLPNEVHAWRKLAGRVRDPITGQRQPITAGEGLAIWMRYTVIGCCTSAAFSHFASPSSCQAAKSLTWAFGCACWAGISLLFALRVYVMYNRARLVAVVFGTAWLTALAIWMAVAATWRASNRDADGDPGLPHCAQSNDARWRAANFGAEALYDLLVLAATLYRLRQLNAMASGSATSSSSSSKRMRTFILRSNLAFFCVSCALSSAAFIVQTAVPNVINAQLLAPPTIALTPIVAIRIIFRSTNAATIDDLLPRGVGRMSVPSVSPPHKAIDMTNADDLDMPLAQTTPPPSHSNGLKRGKSIAQVSLPFPRAEGVVAVVVEGGSVKPFVSTSGSWHRVDSV